MPNLPAIISKAAAALAASPGMPTISPPTGKPTGQAVGGGPWSRWGGNSSYGRVFRMLLPGARFDWEREAGNVWSNSVVALGIDWIGARVTEPQLEVCKVGRNGELTPIPEHGLVALWKRPNEYYNRRTLEKAVALSLKVDGNAYIYKRRDNGGRVCELWWLPHFRCNPLWPADGSEFISGYRISVDGRLVDVPKTDVIHIRDGIDPLNERYGLSALKSTLREVCAVNMEATYTAALLKNSGVPAVAIIPKNDTAIPPTPDQANQLSQKWNDTMTGDDVGGALTFSGDFEVKPVGFSPEQLALDKLPQGAMARVASAVGVAMMSLNLPDPNKTYSNLAEANRTSWGTVKSLQGMIAEGLCDDLVTEDIQVDGKVTPKSGPRDLVVRYDYSQVQEMQESLDSLHQRTREDYKAGVIKRGEAREAIGYEADPDDDVYFVEPGGDDPEGDDVMADGGPGDDADTPAGAKSWRY